MRPRFPSMLILWILNDILRRPAKALLSATALTLMAFLTATPLLLLQALDDTAKHLLANSPAVVIRCLNVGGWTPIPVRQALERIRNIPGVVNPRARIWGAAGSPEGDLTILAVDDFNKKHFLEQGLPLPAFGQAIVGRGVRQTSEDKAAPLTITSARSRDLKIIARFPADSDMATHDIVLTTARDASFILGIPAGMASDLVFDVFHQSEADALKPEVMAELPWPVHITLRDEALKQLSSVFALRGGGYLLLLSPGILALVLLILSSGNEMLSRRSEVGLLRTMGWTGNDLIRMQLLRSALICLPSVTMGISLAYASVFAPGIQWIGNFLGWTSLAPAYYLSSIGAGLILIELFALIVLPYVLASLWPVLILAAQDPLALLKGD